MVLNFNNLTNQLNKLNIKENFIIVHSDLHKHQFFAKNLDIFWQTLLKCLGKNKTYIIPTFTTNFVKFKFWDYYKSKSQTGIFSEYFRKNIADIRSIHPIHSVAIWGKKKNDVPKHKSKSSFGKGSVWEWICESKNVCNLSIGISVNGGATILHYPEELNKVGYRYYKKIKGKIVLKNGKNLKKEFFYFARKKYKKKIVVNNWSKCENDLIKSKILHKLNFNNLVICKMNTYKATNFINKMIKNNENYLVNYKDIS